MQRRRQIIEINISEGFKKSYETRCQGCVHESFQLSQQHTYALHEAYSLSHQSRPCLQLKPSIIEPETSMIVNYYDETKQVDYIYLCEKTGRNLWYKYKISKNTL